MNIYQPIQSISDSINNGPLGYVFANHIYVSLLLTTLVMLIIILMYDECNVTKTGFYIVCVNIMLLFLHNKSLISRHRKDLVSADEQRMMSIVGSGPDIYNPDNKTGELNYLSSI